MNNSIYIDTHAHLYADDYKNEFAEVLQRALLEGVYKMVMPNVDVFSLPLLMALREQYPEYLEMCLGLHPTNVKEDYKEQLEVIHRAISDDVCAIGEIGVDLYRDKAFLKEQLDAFNIQLRWAVILNRPVVLHVREAFEEAFDVLKDYSQVRGVFHCFSGGEEEARKVVSLENYYLGIGGVATFKNAKLLRVLKKSVPLDKIVLETDAPYLAPTPHRGQRNESSYLPLVAQALSDTYEIPLEQIAQITTRNAIKLFNLNV